MKSRLPLDELNALKKRITRHFGEDGRIKSRQDCEDILDEMLDLYLLTLAEAVDGVNKQFRTGIEPTPQEVQETVYRRIDGATWRDRVLAWYAAGGTVEDIMRIADTEMHRISNETALDTAIKAGAGEKTWLTMADWLVRPTHDYIHGVTVPIDAEFYTFDGDHAQAPGGFDRAENNINCRCELEFK